MEITFNHKTRAGYRELLCTPRRIQVTVEGVVPDTGEDVGGVASVQTMLLLKSKDVTAHGVTVTGELNAALLCVTEAENRVSCVRLKREFEMSFDLEGLSSDDAAQLRLAVGTTEARALNPRKLSVTAELIGELSVYRREEIPVETEQGETLPELLHIREERAAFSLIGAVCEKTFAVNEQFRFPEGEARPTELLYQHARFEAEDVQQVGSRAIVKGTLYVSVCYAAEGADCPLTARFNAPFSQLVDVGGENCGSAAAAVELTGAYFDLVDTISGESALDAELHAVLQLVTQEEAAITLFTDAYSNRCPTSCALRPVSLSRVSPMERLRLTGEDALPIAEDCEEVLGVFASLPPLIASPAGLGGAVQLDVIYRSKGGSLAAVHRLLALQEAMLPEGARLWCARLDQQDYRSEGGSLRCRVSVEVQAQRRETAEFSELASVTLEEDAPYDCQSLAAVTLVREPTEPLWTLAKRYHSSAALIEAANPPRAEGASRALLIPRE